jgi:hypothetical protein
MDPRISIQKKYLRIRNTACNKMKPYFMNYTDSVTINPQRKWAISWDVWYVLSGLIFLYWFLYKNHLLLSRYLIAKKKILVQLCFRVWTLNPQRIVCFVLFRTYRDISCQSSEKCDQEHWFCGAWNFVLRLESHVRDCWMLSHCY